MTQQYRRHKWRDRLRLDFIQRTFPPRVVRDLERLDVRVDELDRDALLAGRGLFLYGAVGSGKTIYAAAAMVAVARLCYVVQQRPVPSARLVPTTVLLRNLRGGFDAGNSERGAVQYFTQDVQLLAIDDLGTEKLTEWALQALQEIVNERYEQERSIIATTNADGLDGLAQYLNDARIPSRLGAMCRQRDFGGADRRPVMAEG